MVRIEGRREVAHEIEPMPPARAKAEQEYARYHALLDAQPRAVDAEFEKVAKQLQKPAAPRGKRGKKA